MFITNRNIHPNQEYVDAANTAHDKLSNFLNILNTHQQLYTTLKASTAVYATSTWGKDERTVANLLLTDFEKSGIHLQKSKRDEFIHLNNKILTLGQEFMLGGGSSSNGQETITIDNPQTSLLGLDAQTIAVLTSKADPTKAYIPNKSHYAYQILKKCRNSETRRIVYLAMNAGTDSQINLLEQMLTHRHAVSKLVGYASYGHLWLRDKMVQTPGNT